MPRTMTQRYYFAALAAMSLAPVYAQQLEEVVNSVRETLPN